MSAFALLLSDCISYYGGRKQDFAKALRVAPSVVSRLLAGTTRPTPELCLRLAEVCRRPAADVLRAGHHDDVAALLDSLYGPAPSRRFSEPALSPYERELLQHWRQLEPGEERALTLILTRTIAGRDRGRRRPLRFIQTK